MKRLLFFFFLLSSSLGYAQKKCHTYQCVMDNVQKILDSKKVSDYQKALRNLDDAENYLSDTDKDRKEKIKSIRQQIFSEIEAKLNASIVNEKKARIAQKEAQIATDNATALYWSSEASKLIPTQGLRLLGKVMSKNKDTKSLNFIKEQDSLIFNNSNTHQFQEMKRFPKVQEALFSPNSKFLFTRNVKNEGNVWEMASGKRHDFLQGEGSIHYAQFSPDSKFIFTRNNKDEGKVWEVSTGKIHIFLQGKVDTSEVQFSPDSKFLFVKNDKKEGNIWEIATGHSIDFFNGKGSIHYVKFSPDSKFLFTRNDKLEGNVWEVSTRKLHDFLKNEVLISEAEFSPDSKFILTLNDEEGNVWEVSTGKLHDSLQVERSVYHAQFSPDGRFLYIQFDKYKYECKIIEISIDAPPFS